MYELASLDAGRVGGGHARISRGVDGFDISSDRTRRHATKVLEAYGTRVQKSVFECRIGERQFVELRQRMSQIGLAERDLVRYYTLCRACQAKVELTGGLPPREEKGHIVV